MELEENGMLPFLGMEFVRNGRRLDTKVYKKPTDTGLRLHYQSHVDEKYKWALLNTLLKGTVSRLGMHISAHLVKRVFGVVRHLEFCIGV